MVTHSIVAAICCRNSNRNHLALRPRKLSWRVHGSLINCEMRPQDFGAQTVDLQDIGDSPGLSTLLVIDLLESVVSLVLLNYSYPCHPENPRVLGLSRVTAKPENSTPAHTASR